jgi:nucleotide-binding universal stress UspA family protein
MNDTRERSVVVAYDGSAASGVAVEWAAEEAAARHLPLHALHVQGPSLGTREPQGRTGCRDAERLLLGAEQRAHRVAPGLDVTCGSVEGPVSLALIDASEAADTLVMGAHGHQQRSLADLGSTGWHVASHARCALVTVRRSVFGDAGRPVVLGVDGSRASEAAYRYAFAQARRRKAPLLAVHAWELQASQAVYVVMQSDDERRIEDAAREAQVEAWLQPWLREYPDVRVRMVARLWHPADVLLDAAEEAQLLVVGRRDRAGFPNLMLRSVAFDLLRSASCPLAIVPADAPTGALD